MRARLTIENFREKYVPEPNSGCWLWLGTLNKGYGSFKGMGAHRYSYLVTKGDIPKGYDVMHACDVRACVNPDHLSVGTRYDNVHDMISKGRIRTKGTEHEAKKTHCPKGHPYDEVNTLNDKGRRRCKSCRIVWRSAYLARISGSVVGGIER